MVTRSIVRIAGPSDHQEIWRLLLDAFRENGQFSLAMGKVEYVVGRCLGTILGPGPRGLIGVIGEVGALEGLVILMEGTFWYSHDQHLEEYIVFVDRACRKSFHARALINWMKAVSDTVNLPLLTGVISTERTVAKVSLYARMVPKIGEFFLYRPEAVIASSSAEVA